MNKTLDILLNAAPPELPSKSVKIKRLSKAMGGDVVLELRAIPYGRAAEIQDRSDKTDLSAHILLAGETSGLFKSEELQQKYGAATPIDLIGKLLLPGEIESLAVQVEQLSGFRSVTIEDVKKKSTPTPKSS